MLLDELPIFSLKNLICCFKREKMIAAEALAA